MFVCCLSLVVLESLNRLGQSPGAFSSPPRTSPAGITSVALSLAFLSGFGGLNLGSHSCKASSSISIFIFSSLFAWSVFFGDLLLLSSNLDQFGVLSEYSPKPKTPGHKTVVFRPCGRSLVVDSGDGLAAV